MFIQEHSIGLCGETDLWLRGFPLSVNTKYNIPVVAEAVYDEKLAPIHYKFYTAFCGRNDFDITSSQNNTYTYLGSTMLNCGNNICYVFYKMVEEDDKW